jgi:O-acetylserine/cysteine efflux transporter
MRPAHFLFLVLINLVFALAIITVKFGFEEIPPILFTTLRFLLLSVILIPFLDIHPGQMKQIVIIALGAGGFQFALFYGGIYVTGNVSAVVIASELGIPFSTFLGMVFLQESVGWRRWAGMLLAFSGVMYISFDPDAFTYLTGMLFGVMAAVSGSVASIFMRLVKDIKPFEMQAWIVMISWPPLLFLSLTVEQDIPTILANVTWVGWGAVAFAALVSNLFAHAGMFFLLQRYEVSFIAPLTLMAPIFTIILSVAFLGDAFTLRMFIGAAVTTLGVLIITLRRPAEAVRVEEVSH